MNLEEEKKQEDIIDVSDNAENELNKLDEQKTIEETEENTQKDNEEIKEEAEEIKPDDTVEKPEIINEENNIDNEGQEETNLENEENTYRVVKTKQKKQVKTAVAVISIIGIILILALFSTAFALANLTNTNMVEGVKIKGIDLVGLSREDAKLEVEELIKHQLENQITLTYEEYETSISALQIEASYNIDKAIDEAYSIGRSGNIIKNNYDILLASIFDRNVNIDFSYNDETLTKMCEDVSTKIPGAMKQTSYYIEDDKLIVTKGAAGKIVEIDVLKNLIIDKMIEGKNKAAIEIPVKEGTPDEIDINKIHEEICKEPKDAYYTTDPFTIYPHEDGVDFAITIEEAQKILEEDKTEYEIPLKFTTPAKTTGQIGTEAFPDLITQFSTKYDITNRNRTTNLELASAKIDGCVLLPGEEFSYNKVVGERTIAAGYKEAAIYSGGEVVDGLGGGICQISSTLYNVVVQANLEVTKRSNHQFVTSYVDAGMDATVVYGAIDFKFINTRKYPIKITSTVKNGIAEMKIYGVKEDVEYDIKIETETLSYIPYVVKYIDDPTLNAGVEKVKQYGAQGRKSKAYKVCRLNGVVVSKTLLSTDTYSAMNKIIRRGTKNATTVKSTAPTNNTVTNVITNTPTTTSTTTPTTTNTSTNTTNTNTTN